MSKFTTKKIVFSAALIALATISADFLSFHMPVGGSVTVFSMLLVCLAGFWFGPRVGISAAIVHGLIQFISNPYVIHPVQVILDYFLAFGSLGLSGFFHNKKNGLILGYSVGVLGRFVFSTISGMIFYTEYVGVLNEDLAALWAGVAYNLSYMLPEYILTIILLMIPAVQKALSYLKKMAVQS